MKKIITLFSLLVAVCTVSMAQTLVVPIDTARIDSSGRGVPFYLGRKIQTSGIVYSPNAYPTPNGVAFILNNHRTGIKVYAKKTYGYNVTDGDSVVVVGTLNTYGGWTELDPDKTLATDTIYKVGVGIVDTPRVVSIMDETTESSLIQINNVNMTTSDWNLRATAAMTGGKHAFTVTAGTYSIRIDSFTDYTHGQMFNHGPFTGTFNIRGLGGQYKFAAPYNSGYQISPRGIVDFIPVTTGINDIESKLTVAIVPNPATTKLTANLTADKQEPITTQLFDITGREVLNRTEELTVGTNELRYDVANLNAGIYILQLHTAEKSMVTKISIER